MHLENFTIGNKIRILFSNKWIFSGLFVFTISLFMSIVFIPNIDFKSHYYENSKLDYSDGVITNIEETNSTFNGDLMYRYSFEFFVGNDKLYGYSFDKIRELKIGDKIRIEYLLNKPSISRVEGTSNGPFPITTLFFLLIFLSLGLFITIPSLHGRISLITTLSGDFLLLKTNLISEWRVPFVRINNNQSLYRYEFSYKINGETFKSVKYSTKSKHYSRSAPYTIIINSLRLKKSYLFKDLPNSIKEKINIIQ